jgi:hypothetical protein
VEEVVDDTTNVVDSGVGVGVGSIVEVLEGVGVSAGREGSGVGVGVDSMAEVLEEGVGVSAGGEASGVDVGDSDALGEASTEEVEVSVDGSGKLMTDVTMIDDDVAASVEGDELIGDAELLSDGIGVISEADGITELEAEIVGTSMGELETTVGASGIEVEVLEVLDVRGSAVDMLEELSMMDDKVSESVELEVELMFSMVLLETDGVADETGEGVVMEANDVVDEREEDDPLLHLPKPPWQPVPQ